jgi:hypothetical protein
MGDLRTAKNRIGKNKFLGVSRPVKRQQIKRNERLHQRRCNTEVPMSVGVLSVVRERRVRFMSPASGWLASTGTVPNTHTLAYPRATVCG